MLLKVQMWPDLWFVCDVSYREQRELKLSYSVVWVVPWAGDDVNGWGRRELSSASDL